MTASWPLSSRWAEYGRGESRRFPSAARYRPSGDHRKQIVHCPGCRDEHGRMSNETTRWAGVWPGYRTGRCWMRQGTQKTPLGKLDTSETGGATQADRRQHPSRRA